MQRTFINELHRRVKVKRRVYVFPHDKSAHHLAEDWLHQQIKKDIRKLNFPCTIVTTFFKNSVPSFSYIECYGVIRSVW